MSTPLRYLPNLISGLRVVLVGPIIWALLQERFELAMWLFVAAGVSDGVDGYLAKRFDWTSRLGGILDALADKFLLVSTFVCLWWLGLFPAWLVLLAILRDLVIVVGGVVYNARVEKVMPAPSPVSKLNTLLQIVLAALGVVHLGLAPMPQWLLHGLMYAIVVTVLFSGIGYVREWSRRAVAHARR
jgi:cardiolipin synthase